MSFTFSIAKTTQKYNIFFELQNKMLTFAQKYVYDSRSNPTQTPNGVA